MASYHKEAPQLKDPGNINRSGFKRQGSIRKVLPSVPDMDTQLTMAAKMIDRRTSSPRGSHGYKPFFLEYSLLAEYSLLEKQKLPGIYVIPAAKSHLQWFGVMFIRQGMYQGGVFKFTVRIPETYPDGDCPDVIFETPVFHPQVDADLGILDVRKGFQKWRRNVNHIWHLLLYARRIFYKIDPNDPHNVEAADLFVNDIETFQLRAAQCAQESIKRLYDMPAIDDPHAIRFSEWDPQVHGELYQQILFCKKSESEASKSSAPRGLSWVQKGTLQIFSRDRALS